MTEDKLDKLVAFYKEEKHFGRLKYFWEISVPAEEEIQFCYWLEKCERLGMTFAFAVIERSKDYFLMYGFSDFEISDRKGIKCMQLNFENNDILHIQFMKWQEESTYFALSLSLKISLEINEKLGGIEPFAPYDDGTLE